MADSMTDRRIKERIKIDGRMIYQVGSSGETQEAKLEDLSDLGARIWTYEDLPIGSELECSVNSEHPDELTIKFTATLLYKLVATRKSPQFGYGCALSYIRHPD